MPYCSNCGEKLSDDAYFCSRCGTKTALGVQANATSSSDEMKQAFSRMSVEIEKAFTAAAKEIQAAFQTARTNVQKSTQKEEIVCSNCGTKNSGSSTYCYNCGNKLEPKVEEKKT